MHWLKIIYYLVLALALAGSILASKDRRYVLFIPFVGLNLTVEIVREFIEDSSPLDTSILLFQVIAEYSLLSLLISNFIRSELKRKIITVSIFLIIPLFILLQLFIISDNHSYKFLNQMIEAPFICTWTIFYLFETAKHDEEFEIVSNPMFWISFGNILFYSGSFFSYAFGGYLATHGNPSLADNIYWIARILNILLYILYFIGFLWVRKKLYTSLS